LLSNGDKTYSIIVALRHTILVLKVTIMPTTKSSPLFVEQIEGKTASEIIVHPESPPAQVQGNFQPASVTISGGTGHVVNVGQESPNMRQLTLPQKLTNHSIGYWLVHFVIALLGAAMVEGIVFWFSKR